MGPRKEEEDLAFLTLSRKRAMRINLAYLHLFGIGDNIHLALMPISTKSCHRTRPQKLFKRLLPRFPRSFAISRRGWDGAICVSAFASI